MGDEIMDQLSPEDTHLIPSALLGPMTRMGEKVAAIEGRFGAEIAGLKDDTTQIRRLMHDMANAQQAAIGAESAMRMQLAVISEQLRSHADQVAHNVAAHKEAMVALGAEVKALTTSHHQLQGMWWTVAKVAGVLAAIAAILWPHAKHWLLEP